MNDPEISLFGLQKQLLLLLIIIIITNYLAIINLHITTTPLRYK